MSLYLNDGDVRLYHGDALEQLALMPSESVHCIVTSPPFWGLRDYGTGSWTGGDEDCDHTPEKKPERKFTNGRGEGTDDTYAGSNLRSWTTRDGTPFGLTCGKCGATRVDQQIGLEETPDEWCTRLVTVMREARRVLRTDGVCWIEVGDSYNGSSATAGGNGTSSGLCRDGRSEASRVAKSVRDQERFTAGDAGVKRAPGLKPKDLVGAPWLLAFALRADGWYLRSDTIWARPNPMPESVTDRPTKAHSYVFLLTKSARYFWDADAIREPSSPGTIERFGNGGAPRRASLKDDPNELGNQADLRSRVTDEPLAGRNARSVWSIPTEPTPFAHFATFPTALVERCIKAGTSEHGACSECGAPWRRITDVTLGPSGRKPDSQAYATKRGDGGGDQGAARSGTHVAGLSKHVTTLGWEPSCACIVLECKCAESRTTHLPGVRNDAQAAEQPAAVLHEEVLVGTHGAQPNSHSRLCDQPEGLPIDPSTRTSDGEPRGLRDGAPHGDGGAPWADADARRSRAPQERDQGRQPDRESGSRAEAGPRSSAKAEGVPDPVPALRRDDPSAAACPVCQGSLTPRPPDTVPCRVLDVFMGSGTTALVARRLGRHAIGIELNLEYLAIAAKRLEQLSLFSTEPAPRGCDPGPE